MSPVWQSLKESLISRIVLYSKPRFDLQGSYESHFYTFIHFYTLQIIVNRYKRGLETCRQANLCKSVHSNFNRVRATSMTQRRVENSLDTFAHFRLYRLNRNVFCFKYNFSSEFDLIP